MYLSNEEIKELDWANYWINRAKIEIDYDAY